MARANDAPQTVREPMWVWVLILRMASIGVAYGMWSLSQWLATAKPLDTALGVVLLTLSAFLCALFLFLGTIAPSKVVAKVWKIMGKGLMYVMMFT
jgi:hypothetical protein